MRNFNMQNDLIKELNTNFIEYATLTGGNL